MLLKTKLKVTGIGKIPEDWVISTVGDHVEIKHGYAFKGEFFSDEPNQNLLLTPGNVKIGGGFKQDKFKYTTEKFPEEYILEPGNIIVTMTDLSKGGDTLGYAAKIPKTVSKRFLHNQRLGRLVFKSKKISQDFLYWVLRQRKYNQTIVGSSSGSTVKHTSPTKIMQYTFAVPSFIIEQEKIAKVLSDLDAKIELNREMNKTLESIAEALFKHWFIDFEFPNEEGKPFKSSGGKMVDSEQGKIPEGWKITPLDEAAEFLNGLALQKFPATGDTYLPVIKIAELNRGITDSTDRASYGLPEKYIVNNGDLLFSWSGSLNVVLWCSGKGALNQHLFKVSSETYPKWFVYLWLKVHLSYFQQIAAGKATTMGHIQRHHLSEAKVLVPLSKTLDIMDKVMTPIIEKFVENKLESKNLADIRDLLLPRLMSGKIRVPIEVKA